MTSAGTRNLPCLCLERLPTTEPRYQAALGSPALLDSPALSCCWAAQQTLLRTASRHCQYHSGTKIRYIKSAIIIFHSLCVEKFNYIADEIDVWEFFGASLSSF